MTEIIFYGTPTRASTAQRRVRSTESYALVRSIKHTKSGVPFFRASSCNRRTTNITSVGRTVRSETPIMFLRQDPHALTVLAEVASDDLQQYPAGVRYQRDAPVVAALCPFLLFMEYHTDGIFLLLRHLPPRPNTNDDIEQLSSSLRRWAGSPLRVMLNRSTENPTGPTAFPFANERMASVSSCIVG